MGSSRSGQNLNFGRKFVLNASLKLVEGATFRWLSCGLSFSGNGGREKGFYSQPDRNMHFLRQIML